MLRRVIGARVADPSMAEDLVQETLTRVLEVEGRLDAGSIGPYSIVIARNLIRSQARAAERSARLAPRLLDPRVPDDPAQVTVEAEDRRALAAGLEELSARDRGSLVAHDVHGVPSAELSGHQGASSRTVDVRLTRARARLRVEYLVALHRVELPTPACRPVLLALSAGDKRRQKALCAGEHLLSCRPCAALGPVVVQRRRPRVGLWPALGLGRPAGWLRRHPVHTGAGGALAVAGVVAVVLLTPRGPSAPSLYVPAGQPIALSGDRPLAPYAGREVRGRDARVESAPIPRGFWVGDSAAGRVWVDIGSGDPAPPPLAAGQRVSFVGRLVPTTPEVLTELDSSVPGDRALLERQGFHVDVAPETLTVRGGPPPSRQLPTG